MKEQEERLGLYQRMLKDYLLHWIFPFLRLFTRRFENGFCTYLNVHESSYYSLESLSELYKQKPKKFYRYWSGSFSWFWYKEGRLLPRIWCLIKAIKLTKYELRQTKSN